MFRPMGMLAVCAALLAVSACANDPVKVAQSPLQKAYAAMADYETAQGVGVVFVEDARTPAKVKDALIALEGAATPVFKSLVSSARFVIAAKAAVDAGTGSAEKLQVATENMATWVIRLTGATADMQRAITEAKAALHGTASIWEPSLVPLEPEVLPRVRTPERRTLDDRTLRQLNLQET